VPTTPCSPTCLRTTCASPRRKSWARSLGHPRHRYRGWSSSAAMPRTFGLPGKSEVMGPRDFVARPTRWRGQIRPARWGNCYRRWTRPGPLRRIQDWKRYGPTMSGLAARRGNTSTSGLAYGSKTALRKCNTHPPDGRQPSRSYSAGPVAASALAPGRQALHGRSAHKVLPGDLDPSFPFPGGTRQGGGRHSACAVPDRWVGGTNFLLDRSFDSSHDLHRD